jgi:glycosyltransferase involved in cell wall biosynthesis
MRRPDGMRVVQALGWYFPESLGGTEVYVAAVAREMHRAGIDVRIAAPAPGAKRPTSYEHDGIQVFRYPIPDTPTRAEARGETTAAGARVFHEWLAAERPDVVHVHTFVTGLDLLEIERARHIGARVFVTSHSSALGYICLRGTLLQWGDDVCDGRVAPRRCAACALEQRGLRRPVASAIAALPEPLARVANRWDHPVGTAMGLSAYVASRMTRQRRLFESIDGFFALTGAARAILVANGAPAAKVRINRLGIDADVIMPAAARRRSVGPITVGYLGRLDPIKGVEDLLRAVESLPLEVDFRVDIRGVCSGVDGARVQQLCTMAAQRDPRITVGGPVPRHDVSALLASWDVLCCPSRSLEGGPTVALEAFTAGTPVIGSRVGGLAEIVSEDHGRLVHPGDWRGLAALIRELAQRPEMLDAWRAKLPPPRSTRDIAADYLTAYSA